MPQIPADPPAPSCFHLYSGSGIEESQSVAPDRFLPRARTRERDRAGRFAKGHSGNPRGRPPGIPNPQRRVVTVSAFRKNPEAAMALFERKSYLLRPLTEPFLPPRARPVDPAERLGLDLSAIRTPGDAADAIGMAVMAASRGEIAPSEVARLVRRMCRRLPALRRREALR